MPALSHDPAAFGEPIQAADRSSRLAALRAQVRAIESAAGRSEGKCLPFGIEAMDRRLEGGGLAISALHEAAGACPDPGDEAAAILFVAGIAARLASQEPGGNGTVLWVLARRDLFAPGLAQAGLPPERVLYAHCGRDEESLAVMEEGLRHGGLAAVVGEVQRVSMVSTRRLQLAAEAGATPALMLKGWRRRDEDPLAPPSAATTRWRIACIPSADLPVPGIGRPRWRIELARQRGGEGFLWTMEGNDAEGRLALPAEPADRAAAADRGERARAAA